MGALPTELRLAGYVGPTLFTSDTRDGHCVTLAQFDAALASHAHARSIVLGTMRETQGLAPTAYAAFCSDKTGAVVHVELDAPHRVRFANSGVKQLARCLAAVAAAWSRLADEHGGMADDLRDELAAIDPVAVSGDDAFWPMFLESIDE